MRAAFPRRNPGRPGRGAGLRHALVGAVALFVGCSLDPEPPTVEAVAPAWGYNGENTEIAIEGSHFFPSVIVTEAADGGGRIEGTFQVWLEGGDAPVALDGVQHLAYDALTADVPAGVTPGVYDLRVEVPSGLEALLEDAFTVTDTRADHLDIYVDAGSYPVASYAAMTITLQDPTERAVPQALEVEVRAEPAQDPTGVAEVEFYVEGLDDQVPLETGVGVRGRLEEDGTGVVLVTSEVESDVRFKVVPVGESVVRGDEQVLSWDPGLASEVELVLPRSPFRTVAGTSFDLTIRLKDEYDNVLSGVPASLLLWDGCGNEITPFVEIVGEGTVPLTLTTSCAEDTISAFALDAVWTTETFEVLPGPHTGYSVQAAPAVVTAGDDLLVFVEAVDAYGNLVTDHIGDIRLRDDAGGLDPDLAIGEQLCPGFAGGSQLCTATPWAASPAVVITAEDSLGESGDAPPIEVRAADPTTVIVLVDSVSVEAGEEFGVLLRVIDAFGNSVAFDPAGTDPVSFSDASGTIACRWTGSVEGGQGFACAIEGAVSDADIVARVLGLSGAALDPLLVTNGPLARVEIDPQSVAPTAGVAFTVDLAGYDAYGNPYLVQSDPVVDLDDTAGTMSPRTAALGPSGTATVSAVLYGAGTARIYAAQAGVRLGASRAIQVEPAALDSLFVSIAPWVSVDEPAVVEVTAVDAYGNAVDTYAGTVALESRGAGCDDAVVTDFVDGVARLDLDCTTPTLAETLVATDDDGYGGESEVFDVVDLACADGPTAALSLDGDQDAIVCLAEGSTVEVTADTSASTRGDAALVVRHFDDGETAERALVADTTFTYDTTGTRRVEALLVDADACAALVDGFVYVGADDGEPTGPVAVTVGSTSVASIGSVSVGVVATDCTGDVASGQEILLWADLGVPGGTASGEGLAVTLDGVGAKNFTWTFTSGHIGTATIYAGSVGGGAVGTGTLSVTGDAALPEIVSIDPSGATAATIDAIEVVFTEPMLARNAGSAQIPLTGPGGVVAATYALSSDLTTLTITPDDALDGAAGVYSLAFSTNVRDLAGNQLDGAWTNAAAAYTATFGAVASTLPTISSCTHDPERFTPDGDDGLGAEADATGITPTATASPAWWWLVVTDADGARVRSLRQPGTDTVVEWDGRGDDGLVAAAGTYALSLSAIDTNGNVGAACDVTVVLEQHVVVP